MFKQIYLKAMQKVRLAQMFDKAKDYQQAKDLFVQAIQLFHFCQNKFELQRQTKIKIHELKEHLLKKAQLCKIQALHKENRISKALNVQIGINSDPSKKTPKRDRLQFNKQLETAIVKPDAKTTFQNIIGLDSLKNQLKEAIILPLLRPDLFNGLRSPPKGILFYGPPGNGKTSLAKCISNQTKSTFMNLSAATLVSKYVGDSQKMIKSLFQMARQRQPCIIFIDEIDSLLTQRQQSDKQSSRRLKTQFLLQMDGFNTFQSERVMLIGATNFIKGIDEAALRRFQKKIFIDNPDEKARLQFLNQLLKKQNHKLQKKQIQKLSSQLKGYSYSDIKTLAKEAAGHVLTQYPFQKLKHIRAQEIRGVELIDFIYAKERVKPSKGKK